MPTGLKKLYLCPACKQSLRAMSNGKLFPHNLMGSRCNGSNKIVDARRAAQDRKRREVGPVMYLDHCGFDEHGAVADSVLASLEYDGPHLAEDSLVFGHEQDVFSLRDGL